MDSKGWTKDRFLLRHTGCKGACYQAEGYKLLKVKHASLPEASKPMLLLFLLFCPSASAPARLPTKFAVALAAAMGACLCMWATLALSLDCSTCFCCWACMNIFHGGSVKGETCFMNGQQGRLKRQVEKCQWDANNKGGGRRVVGGEALTCVCLEQERAG